MEPLTITWAEAEALGADVMASLRSASRAMVARLGIATQRRLSEAEQAELRQLEGPGWKVESVDEIAWDEITVMQGAVPSPRYAIALVAKAPQFAGKLWQGAIATLKAVGFAGVGVAAYKVTTDPPARAAFTAFSLLLVLVMIWYLTR